MRDRDAISKIGFVLVDGFSLMSLSSAVEPLRAANTLSGEALYSYSYIPISGARATASSGAIFEGFSIEDAGYDFDVVFVAAAGNPAAFENLELFKFLKILNSKRVALGGISGGPVLLAKAGVMDGRRFTVHWDHREALAEISSELLLERNIYVIDRDRYTCAGGIAPLDMMSALIARDHGSELAKDVNDWFIHTSVRDSAHPQRASLVEKYNVHHPAVLSALELMQNHISDPLTSLQLAELSNIGERQLVRLFKSNLGKGPNRFYRDLRLEHARILVQQSALSVIEISIACGFDGASYFAQVFKEAFGMTPTEMRRKARN